jgi:hypothetical protein
LNNSEISTIADTWHGANRHAWLQKRLARYAQLHSRVGFVHQFRPLSGRELQESSSMSGCSSASTLAHDQHVDTAVINAIARVTGGNFRLVQRPFAQVQRIIPINQLPAVTTEVVSLAREKLVDGPFRSTSATTPRLQVFP